MYVDGYCYISSNCVTGIPPIYWQLRVSHHFKSSQNYKRKLGIPNHQTILLSCIRCYMKYALLWIVYTAHLVIPQF